MGVGALAQLIVGKEGPRVDWTMAFIAGFAGSLVGGLIFSLLAGDGLDDPVERHPRVADRGDHHHRRLAVVLGARRPRHAPPSGRRPFGPPSPALIDRRPAECRSGRVHSPGLVCAHHHLYSTLARGMPAPPRTPTEFLDDPRVGVVAARSGARSRDARMVGQARRPRGARGGVHRDHRPPRVAERDRGIADGDRRRLRRGRRAGVDVLRRHRSSRRRRCPPRAGGERPVPASVRGRRSGGRGMVGDPRRVHVLGRHARGGRRTRP